MRSATPRSSISAGRRRDYQLALDEAVRSDEPEPELPADFREWGQPEMWLANISALR